MNESFKVNDSLLRAEKDLLTKGERFVHLVNSASARLVINVVHTPFTAHESHNDYKERTKGFDSRVSCYLQLTPKLPLQNPSLGVLVAKGGNVSDDPYWAVRVVTFFISVLVGQQWIRKLQLIQRRKPSKRAQ
jgi:hypothetical protein